MTRVASLYLPALAIERLRRLEPRALPELRPVQQLAVDDDPGACSMPRSGGWRPGARWARAAARAVIDEQAAALPRHQRPSMRELGRRSEPAEHPFKTRDRTPILATHAPIASVDPPAAPLILAHQVGNKQLIANACPAALALGLIPGMPGKPGYVVRVENGQRVLSTMKWAFPTRKPRKRPAREGEMPFLHDWWTNCRNLTSNMLRPWLLKPEHRCLVPFSRFAEPKTAADRTGPGDTSWWFMVSDQPEPCFAGVWKVDQDHDRVYAFCTTEPNPLVAPNHPKAMPAILMAEDHGRWLNAPAEEALALVSAYPSQLMSVL